MRMLAPPAILLALLSSTPIFGQAIPFDSEHWDLTNAQVLERDGRKAVTGLAVLRNVTFGSGTVEFSIWAPDVRATGGRAYPGLLFRMKSTEECERIYIRPHRAGLYADAVQYAPVFNGVAGWQLYSGEGFTNSASVPLKGWVSVRVDVAGRQARVFIGDMATPALVVNDLKRGITEGALALYAEGPALFSDFRYRSDAGMTLPPPPAPDRMPGVIADWQLSKGFPALEIETDRYPDPAMLKQAQWRRSAAEPGGLVDIARYVAFGSGAPQSVLARATVPCRTATGSMRLELGYSDAISVFVNKRLVFMGESSYQSRDSAFLGVVGYNDAVNVPLTKGPNEVLLIVTESMGGWGFQVRDASAVTCAPGVRRLWETARSLRVPESAAFDSSRKVIYVGQYDPTRPSMGKGLQTIARLSMDGRKLERDWLRGVNNPTGIAVNGDKLWIVERRQIAEADIKSASVVRRYPVPSPGFLNDIAVDPSTRRVFVSDSQSGAIYALSDGTVQVWFSGPEVRQPNGIIVTDDRLVVGCNGDRSVKSIDLTTKAVTVLATLGPGLIDGIAAEPDGSLLVSHNEGRLYRIAPGGKIAKTLDTSVPGRRIADFAYVPALRAVVIPTYIDGRVMAYRVR